MLCSIDVVVPNVSVATALNSSTVLEGTNVTFTCTAEGAPKPSITWSREFGNLSTSKFSSRLSEGRNVLLITNVTNNEEGVYECTAHNRGKPVTKQVKLIVHGKKITVGTTSNNIWVI